MFFLRECIFIYVYFRIAFQVNNIVETFQRDEFTATLESRLGTFPVVFESRECAATHKIQIGKGRSLEALAYDGEVVQVQFFLGVLHELHQVAFILREGDSWRLAPAYDLTGSRFPSADPWSAHGGFHPTSVNGKNAGITDADLLAVADRFGIGTARDVLARVKDAVRTTLPPSP